MISTQQINQWVQDIIASLPPGIKNLTQDTQAHLRSAMQQTFSQLELVTQEEFDTQVKVLQKTREKLEKLEARLTELEKLQDKGIKK